jgi:hypothetical protein
MHNIMKLNKNQSKAILYGLGAIAVMSFFPPWIRMGAVGGQIVTFPLGYGPIFEPDFPGNFWIAIDFPTLFLQWFIAAIVTGIAVILLKTQASSAPRSGTQ